MSTWITITLLVAFFMVVGAILSAYSRGYKVGYHDGYEECKLLEDIGVETNTRENKYERVGKSKV